MAVEPFFQARALLNTQNYLVRDLGNTHWPDQFGDYAFDGPTFGLNGFSYRRFDQLFGEISTWVIFHGGFFGNLQALEVASGTVSQTLMANGIKQGLRLGGNEEYPKLEFTWSGGGITTGGVDQQERGKLRGIKVDFGIHSGQEVYAQWFDAKKGFMESFMRYGSEAADEWTSGGV